MDVSVTICTYNRSDLLRNALISLQNMIVPPAIDWEIVVVDNNSTDDTRQVAMHSAAASAVPVRYVFESQQGIAPARNRALAEVDSEIIAFVDDDCTVEPGWFRHMISAFKDTDAVCVGGQILPHWNEQPPLWFDESLYGILGLLDLGSEMKKLGRPSLWNANLAFRTAVLQRYGNYNCSLGKRPGWSYSGEETELLQRLLDGGESLWYAPEMRVRHHILAGRLSKGYFRRWRFDQGLVDAMHTTRSRNAFGALRATGELASQCLRYAVSLPVEPRRAFHEQLKIMRRAGFLFGLLRDQQTAHR
jgi:glycosyltransferase involved in cell wall biosynthesis